MRGNNRRYSMGLILLAVCALAVLVGSVMPSLATGGGSGTGPWTIVIRKDAAGGYLLNTTTGEVWLLRENAKLPVREPAAGGTN